MDDRYQVLQALLDFLEHRDVEHCVVGDTRRYPQEISSDVDIVVRREAFAEVPRMLSLFCRERDVHLVQLIQHEQTAVYFVLAWTGEAGELCFLAPDFCSDYCRTGRRLLTADELLAQREPAVDDGGNAKSFYVPPPHMRFIYYLLKKIDKADLRESHDDYLSGEWRADPGGAWAQVCRFWPAAADAELLAQAATANEWSEVRCTVRQLKRALHRSVPLSIAGVLGECHRGVMRVLRPTGLVAVFLGADGSGKSTVIERTLADLAPVFRSTCYLHLRPRIVAGGKAATVAVAAPHILPPRRRVASLAKLALFLFDYVVGYVVRVRPLAARSTFLAFDRYYHDLLVDPRRYRYGGAMALARWAAKCVPGPDLWVLLDAPAEVLQRRKSEVSIDESERQREDYLKLVKRMWNATVVDASQDLDQVVVEVEAAVLRRLEQRLEFRYSQLQAEENPTSTRLLLFFCRHKVPVLSRLIRVVFNCDIYCRIPSPIHMPHPYGIIIHSKTVIGSRVTVMQQVTIGTKDAGRNVAPVIEDDVYVGAGAKVLGGVRVGRGAVVGANAVVTRDVPPYCTVVGANRIVRGGAPRSLDDRARPPAADAQAGRESLLA